MIQNIKFRMVGTSEDVLPEGRVYKFIHDSGKDGVTEAVLREKMNYPAKFLGFLLTKLFNDRKIVVVSGTNGMDFPVASMIDKIKFYSTENI